MVVTTLPILSKYAMGFPNVMVGAISAAIYLSTLFATSILNTRMNSRTRRKAFLASSVIIVVSMLSLYFATPVTIWMSSAVIGLSFGLVFPNVITSATMHGDRTAQERLLSIYSVSLSLSLIIGPSIETYLLGFIGYRMMFLAFLPLAMLGMAASWFIKFPDVEKESHGRATLTNDGFLASILTITIYNVPFAAITTFLAIYAIDQFSVSRSVAYSAFIYFFAVSFITRSYLALRPLKYLKVPILLSAAITVAGLAAIPMLNSFALFIVVMGALGIPHGSIFPMSTIMAARGTTREERNAVNSYFFAYNNVLFIVVPVVFGFMTARIGYGSSFLLLSVPAAAACILLFRKFSGNRKIFYK